MDKKKWLILGVVAILAFSIGIYALQGKSYSELSKFDKVDGIVQVQEGVVVELPTKEDNSEVTTSIDPKTGAPTLKLEAKAKDKTVFIKRFIAEDTGMEVDMPYVKDGTKNIPIYDPINTLAIVPIPRTNEYLITFNGTIYKTNWEEGRLEKILKDEVNGYNKDDVLAQNIPLWGTNPIISPTGTYLLFYSDRSAINGSYNGEIWAKDLITGNERPLQIQGTGVLVGWLNDTELIFAGIETVLINLETGDVKKLLDNNVTDVQLVKEQLVYLGSRDSLIIESLTTGEKKTITSSLINSIGSIEASGSWIAMTNQIRDEESEFNILIYNIDSNIWKMITSPENTWIDGFYWVNDSTLHVLTSTKGTLDEATYIVNIDEVKVIK